MARHDKAKENHKKAGERRTYKAPTLTEFGAVRDLTAAGTGTRTEGAAMTSRRRRA